MTSWNRAVNYWEEKSDKYILLQHPERKSRKNRHFPPECFTTVYSGYDPSKVDLWAVGIIAVALSTARYPFNPKSKYSYQAQWAAFVARHPMHEHLKQACSMMFEIEPHKRLAPFDVSTSECEFKKYKYINIFVLNSCSSTSTLIKKWIWAKLLNFLCH